MTNSERVYQTAKGLIGQHIIPKTPDNNYGIYGCAQSVNEVWQRTFGRPIGGGASTALMLASLTDATRFVELPFDEARPGDVVIAATGTSKFYPYAHGHVGLFGERWIMSNSSESGTWEANYLKEAWIQYFTRTMGFPTRVFRIKNE